MTPKSFTALMELLENTDAQYQTHILVENIQAASIFSDPWNCNITDSDTKGCFGWNTYAIENDVFISIPKI